MTAYIIRRLLLMIPTLFGIMLITFFVIQFTPGGPIEQILAEMKGTAVDASSRFTGGENEIQRSGGVDSGGGTTFEYRGAQGLDPRFIEELEQQFGFDKPAHERFMLMMWDYLRFDFGESYFLGRPVLDLIVEKMPVSVSLGLWTMLITYLVSIPLGIRKAVQDGTPFDVYSSGAIIVGYAIPGFLFGILLIILFAGGRYFDLFPLRGLVSENWDDLSWPMKILDYFWHITLPVTAMVIGSFATLTMLTKNSFLDEINKAYVITARSKGLTERSVLYGHVFRNAMLIVIAGFPGAFISVLFTGSFLIEVIFSLDGLGLLGWEATINRDYALMFATLYIFTLMGLILGLLGDIMYTIIDPRIDFEARN